MAQMSGSVNRSWPKFLSYLPTGAPRNKLRLANVAWWSVAGVMMVPGRICWRSIAPFSVFFLSFILGHKKWEPSSTAHMTSCLCPNVFTTLPANDTPLSVLGDRTRSKIRIELQEEEISTHWTLSENERTWWKIIRKRSSRRQTENTTDRQMKEIHQLSCWKIRTCKQEWSSTPSGKAPDDNEKDTAIKKKMCLASFN